MSESALKYLLAMAIVVLVLVVGVLIQNWWDERKENRE
jgi:hypothetical protein